VQVDISSLAGGPFTWFDAAALVLLLLFAWRGFRRGLLSWLAGIGATFLSFALSFVLAPTVGLLMPRHAGWDTILGERLTFVVLLVALRLVLGYALRELVAVLRPVLRALPPLYFADRLLGILPSLALGTAFVLLLLVCALFLPVDRRVHDAAAHSYLDRVVAGEGPALLRLLPRGDLLAETGRMLAAGRHIPAPGAEAVGW